MWVMKVLTAAAALATAASAASVAVSDNPAAAQKIEGRLLVEDVGITRGLEWLWQQSDASYGFKELTGKAVMVLQLANASSSSWYGTHNLNSVLAVQQMQIQLLLLLTRHGEAGAAASELATYILALSSLCLDPRQLHGIDVVGVLNHRTLMLDWELGIASLASCTAGTHVRKRQLRRLLDATQSPDNLSTDTLSMIMMALDCIVQDHRNRHLQHYLSAPTRALARKQKSDGSYGNSEGLAEDSVIRTTAMAMQALQATDPAHHYWNYTAAHQYIASYQQQDGSYGLNKDIETTVLALLALGPRSLANIKDLECHRQVNDEYSWAALAELTLNVTPTDHMINSSVALPSATPQAAAPSVSIQTSAQGKVMVSYTLWVDTNSSSSSIRTMNVTTDSGSSFYEVMQLAAQKDGNFAFEATEWPNGHYIHTLAGWKEEAMTYRYWLLYKLDTPPDISRPPSNQCVAPFGVDDLLVDNNHFYLFWYKKL